jgi:hypothetical protein
MIEELTTDFSRGMYDSVSPGRYPKASVRQIFNGRVQPDGSVERRWGGIRTSAAVPNAGTGYGGSRFTTAAGTDQIIAICGAKAYKSEDYGTTWTEIATGLRQDYYTFAEMRVGATNYLFMANGDTTIKRWDGTTWDTVPNAPSGVKFLAAKDRRLWVSGHSGVLVQACKINDPETWSSPNGLTVQVDQTPTAMAVVASHLLVFDRHSASYIDGYGEQTLLVAAGATGWSRSVGCTAFRSVVGVGDNGLCWLSERGVEYYSPGSEIKLVSNSVQEFLGEIDWEELYGAPGRISATYNETSQNYHIVLSTNGTRNNRKLILNLFQRDVDYQRSGNIAAAAIDRPQSTSGGDLLFGGDSDGYLAVVDGGFELESDSNGYMRLDTDGSGGDPTSEDADGYLDTVTDDTLPATLFVAPYTDKPNVVYSIGYDGFVRRHYNVDSDDMLSDESGGVEVTMSIRTRPYGQRYADQTKRGRTIHVSSIQEDTATITVQGYGRGTATASQDLTMTALGVDHADRQKARIKFDADAPQIELRTKDKVKITMIGLSFELLRKRR